VKLAATIVLLAAALLPAAAARAQSGGSYFDIVDLDHDRRISLAEYIERFSYAFRMMDRNHDGVVEESEQEVPGSPRLTLAQLKAQLSEQFHRQDKNHDGTLSPREFLAPPG
jgi:Ca2+-binding EF-hand superfamily protein